MRKISDEEAKEFECLKQDIMLQLKEVREKYKDRPRGMDPCRKQTLEEKAIMREFSRRSDELKEKYGSRV